jgi:hypothetical protein
VQERYDMEMKIIGAMKLEYINIYLYLSCKCEWEKSLIKINFALSRQSHARKHKKCQ